MNQILNDIKNACIIFWNKFKHICHNFFIRNKGKPFTILTAIAGLAHTILNQLC
jgi:hypothetical protein